MVTKGELTVPDNQVCFMLKKKEKDCRLTFNGNVLLPWSCKINENT